MPTSSFNNRTRLNKDEISDSLSEKRVWLLIALLSSGFGDWSREERSYSIKRGGRTNLPSVTRVAGVISEAFHQRNRANRKGRDPTCTRDGALSFSKRNKKGNPTKGVIRTWPFNQQMLDPRFPCTVGHLSFRNPVPCRERALSLPVSSSYRVF